MKSEFKAKFEDIDAEVRETMRHVREGAIERSVNVETLMDWKSNSVTTVRLDTGEVVRTRAMTPTRSVTLIAPRASSRSPCRSKGGWSGCRSCPA